MRKFLLTFAFVTIASAAQAAVPELQLTLKDHVFTPASLTIPANTKVKVIVHNRDASAEEFDSKDLNREKIIPANSTGFVYIGPLAAGTYHFMGEFNAATAQGTLIVQ